MEIFLCGNYAYKLIRGHVCKQVYRSGGKGRRKRVKWVKRA